MKTKRNLLICTVLFVILLFTFALSVAASDAITVYIDDELVKFDVEPQIINGRTMVPMRKIFEHLSLEVRWLAFERKITVIGDPITVEIIRMYVDNPEMKVYNKTVTLDVPPTIIDGRTLIPLRAVAEALSAKVEWIGETRTVKITTPYPYSKFIPEEPFSPYHIKTSYSEREFIDMSISGDVLTVKGAMGDEKITDVLIRFDTISSEKRFKAESSTEFEVEINLAEVDITDETTLDIAFKYAGKENYRFYTSDTVFIESTGVDYVFKTPLVLDMNTSFINYWKTPVIYINPDVDPKIVELSNKICQGAESDYEKAWRIHDWIAENIYYDYRYYTESPDAVVYDAVEVLEERKTVCDGYSNLFMAMMHAQKIPCKKVRGYALGEDVDTNYWRLEDIGTSQLNHAWNQAYVDNRWINIDATWSSLNKYKDGKMIYGGLQSHKYFDTTISFLSYNHKCLS